MDSESSAGVHKSGDYMVHHGSPSDHYQPSSFSSESVEYTPLKEDPPPSLLPTWLMVMGFILVLFWVWRSVNRHWENYQRRQAVLERRRRAGIPDEDSRPFEIAYAEAALRRREQDEERRRREQEEAEASQQQDSDWSRLGRTISHSQDSRYEARPYSANLVQRRPTTQQQPILFPPFNGSHQVTLPLRGMQPIESPTISSSDSPPHPPPPVWQDQYAPPEIRAQHDRQREQALAAATTSSLGRRSRKHLVLDGDSNSDAEIPSRVRRRTNQWGTSEAIDGDNNARWVTSNALGQGQGQRRIRKRDAEADSDIENEDPRAKSKRKVDAELPSIPGQFKSPTSDHTNHASAISGPGKRKAREDEEATEIDEGRGQQTTKQKKRVRVLSYHESKQGDVEPVDEDVVEGEDSQESAPEPIRQPGDEWTEDGLKYKMDEDDVVRVLGYVKEETSSVHPGRYSPKRSIKTAIRAKWLTLEEYAEAEKAGSLVPGMQEEYISIEQHPLSRAGSEAPSDWSGAIGQTPLKTGGMKTGLGSDRHPPPFASLPHAGNLSVEQHRLLHLASPARKGMMLGGKSLRPMGSQSQWERKQAEANAMEALREARRKMKAEATPPVPAVKPAATVAVLGETSKSAQPAVAPTTSLPTFKLTAPTSTATAGEPKPLAFTLPGASTSTSTEQKKDEDKKAAAPKNLHVTFGPATIATFPTASTTTTTDSTSTTTAPSATTSAAPSLFPVSTTAAATSATTPTPLFGNPKAEDKKSDAPASSGLTFKLPGSTAPASGADKPGFSFGGGSLFGATAPNSTATTAPSITTPATTTAPTAAPTVPTNNKPSETPKLSFGFGATTSSTTTPLFGAQATQPSSTAPSTTAPTNIFGASRPSAATDDASKRPGATPLQPSAGGLFGAAAPSQPNGMLFGGTTSGGFGTSTAPAFGTTAPKPDASAAKPSFNFGAATTAPSTSGFGFGTTTAKPADSTAADKPASGGLSILGAAQKGPQSSAPSGFAPSAFGGQASSNAAGTSAFGQMATNGTSTTTPAFGQATAARSTPTTATFGQPASTTSAFGQPSNTSSGFGQPAGTTTTAFGMTTPASSLSFGQLSATTPTATGFGSTTPAATTTTFGQRASTPAVTTPSASTFGASGPTSAFGNTAAAGSSKPPGFSFSFGGSTPGFGGGSGANSAPGTPAPTSAVAPTFTFGAGTPKPGDGTTSPRATPSTPGGRSFKPLPRARR